MRTKAVATVVVIAGLFALNASPGHTARVSGGGARVRAWQGGVVYDRLVQRSSSADSDIFVSNGRGIGRNLTGRAWAQYQPEWSPDGRWIAFSSAGNLRLIRPDGSGERVLVPLRWGEEVWWIAENPSWSPDGTKIVYEWVSFTPGAESPYGKAAIRTIPVGGGRPRTLVPASEINGSPEWSPDGRRIVFDRMLFDRRSAVTDIFVIPAAGGEPKNLTLSTISDLSPHWTPDGRIIFVSGRACGLTRPMCGRDVYVMSPEGGNVEALTSGLHDANGDGISPDLIFDAQVRPDSDALGIAFNPADGTGPQQSPEVWTFTLAGTDGTKMADELFVSFDWEPRCTVQGTRAADVLRGTADNDLICGLGGDDVIRGLGGDDVVFGHGGNDRIAGGPGADIVVGNSGRDRCDGDEEDHSRVC